MKPMYKILSLLAIMLFVLNYCSAIPGGGAAFQGTVKINGAYPDEDVVIEVYLNGAKKDETATYYSGGRVWYVIDVTGGTNGDKIKFKIDGNWANEEGTYDDNVDYINLDLTVTTGASTTTTTTTIRGQTIIMHGVTTTTVIQTIPAGRNLGTTTPVAGATMTTVPQNGNFQPTTTAEKTSESRRIIISQKNSQTKSPDVIGSMVNFATGNSITFLLVIGAFLAGYYVQKIRR